MFLPLKSTGKWRFSPALKSGRAWVVLVVATMLTSLLLAACGEEATPTQAPPTATPIPSFQQVNNPTLLFTMNVPFGWNKTTVDANTVVYTNPNDQNIGIGVVSRQIGKLTPESQRLAQERADQLKRQFPGMQEDPSGGGTLNLVDTSLTVSKMSYTNASNVDVIQYAVQANNVKAERAYVLFAITTTKDAETYRPLFLDSFKSFMSTAAASVSLTPSSASGVGDPTVMAANNGGYVRPTGRSQQGAYLPLLVEWETPPLNALLKQPRLTGLFPYDYKWRLRPFPQADKPALYLESNVVDKTAAEATMLFGVYKDAFSTTSPTTDDWRKYYTPVLELLKNQNLKSYGPNVTIGEIKKNDNNDLYRAPWTARNETGDVTSRGVIIFSRSGTHGVVSLLSLSQFASVKQSLVDGLDQDFQTMVASFEVKF